MQSVHDLARTVAALRAKKPNRIQELDFAFGENVTESSEGYLARLEVYVLDNRVMRCAGLFPESHVVCSNEVGAV